MLRKRLCLEYWLHRQSLARIEILKPDNLWNIYKIKVPDI